MQAPPLSLDKLFEDRQSRLYSLPPELQYDIKSQVRVLRARKLCNQLVRAEAQGAYPLFLSLVTRFIEESEQNELNPHAVYDTRPGSNNTCLQFIEIRCMRVASTMHRLVNIRDPASVPPELDPLRELMIQQFAIRRNNKNKQTLRTLDGNSTVEELIYSIQRVADLSYTVLKTSIRGDVTPLSETALALSDECCDQFIMIIGNDDNTPGLKEEAKKLLIKMLEKLHSISQDRNNLSESIKAVGRRMHDKIKRESWWHRYAQDHNYQQGGNKSKSFKNQSKNKSNHRASKKKNNKNSINRKNKNKKNKKKTLRLRNNK
jgi:hypothetical protein